MQIKVSRSELSEAVGHVSRALSSGSAGSVATKGIRIDARDGMLHLAAASQDLAISDAVKADFGGESSRVLPGKVFANTIRALPGDEIVMEFDDAKSDVAISAGGAAVELRTITGEQLPPIAEPTGAGFVVDAADFTDALGRVVVAASKDESRPVLTGVLIEASGDAINMVATDSYRLALQTLDSNIGLADGKSVLVPATALAEVVKMFGTADKVTMHFGERNIAVESGPTKLVSQLIAGEYPQYRQVLPSRVDAPAVLSREVLLEAVRRAKVITDELPLRFQFGSQPGVCTVGGASAEVGVISEAIEAAYDGPEITISFNPSYVVEGLGRITTDEVALHMSDPLRPALLLPADGNGFQYVLMPVRV